MRRTSKLLVFLSILAIFTFGCQLFNNINPNEIPQEPAGPFVATTQEVAVTVPPVAVEESGAVPLAVSEIAPEELLVKIYENVSRGVVAIQVLTQDGSSLGSGFVFDKEGHIVTNYHVVEGQTDLEVDFSSGFKTRGEVTAIDTDSDLAI